MNGRTHLMAGIATGMAYCAYTTGRFDVAIVGMAVVGALISDLDHPQSLASGIVPGASMVLSISGIRHRGFTHSALFVVVACELANLVGLPLSLSIAFGVGILSHMFLDMMTSAGVPFAYPLKIKYRLLPRFLSPLSWLIESLVQTGLLFAIVSMGIWFYF